MVDRDAFIRAMRGVAHSVTVVTTQGPAGRHGTTVSAFCSVSADPPMALVCLNNASKITDLVLKNGSFTINVLPDGADHLADRFAGRHDKEVSDRFDGIEVDADGTPQIEGAAVFHCDVHEAVLSGSHQVVIGKVLACESGTKHPLLYLNGDYHEVAVPAANPSAL